ncbi:hypothetical protein CEUSTIGMA_g12143.t1 [Chlamydomonas eustigma]|uniref:3'-5' exonuclease domain-containing protein n=1 Tax=Chlamydomonas eustigma TaxID=1157962 RepID=A0A250XNQ3_9CHLO|nr:hypothetical protein CEUSTIGMA_g12143.t1 [Chlamydomonas eustigma]|eukprot:GAX84721.1 hypothetical protein CEUSTIGMA_g12143.t1 [Chlamydomonas eustigma]
MPTTVSKLVITYGMEMTDHYGMLQVSTESHVMVFDLLKLGSDPVLSHHLDECLKLGFHNKAVLKLGFELAGDLIMDLKHLWLAHLDSLAGSNNILRVQRSAGLSTLSQALLGKPLDKSMQVSDWEARPLSARQFRYACMDAAVLVLLYRTLERSLKVFEAVLRSKKYSYVTNAAKFQNSKSKSAKALGATAHDSDDDDRGSGGDTARQIESDSVPLLGDSVPLSGDSVPLSGDSVPLSGDSVPLSGDSVPLSRDSVPFSVPKTSVIQLNSSSSGCNLDIESHEIQRDRSKPTGASILVCGAGVPNAFIPLTFKQLTQVSGGRVVDIVERKHEVDKFKSATGPMAVIEATSDEGQGLERFDGGAAGPSSITDSSVDDFEEARREVKFLLDTMLGRLCRWLRCLGVDAEVVEQQLPRDCMIMKIAQVSVRGIFEELLAP